MPTARKNSVQRHTQGLNYYLELQEHGGNKRHTGFLFVHFIIGFVVCFFSSTDHEYLNYLELEKTTPPLILMHLRKCAVYIEGMRFLNF